MYERGKSSQTSEQVVDLLAAAAQAADDLFTDLLGDRGLTTPLHRQILQVLAEHGPHARPDLATQTGAAPEEAADAVADLLKKNLVTLMTVHVGGPQELVLLAPPGRAALDRLETAPARTEDALLSSLTRGERGQLAYLLRRVCTTAQAHRQSRAS